MTNITEKFIKELEENTDDVIKLLKVDELEKIIEYANKKYSLGEPILTDETYDIIVDYLHQIKPNSFILKQIGYKVRDKKKEYKLPYHMGSMNKIKREEIDKFNKWKKKYNSNKYVVSNKMDGVSAMFIINKQGKMNLYTRGDGTYGQNISHLLEYMNIMQKKSINKILIYLKENNLSEIIFRGELIMNKNTFYNKYSEMANPRNLVAGKINAKKIDMNVLNDIDLIMYEIIYPWINIDKQYELMKILELNIAPNELINNLVLSLSYLSNILINRKNNSKYEIDGLVISDINTHIRNIEGNPEYSFAFKETTENDIKEAIVKDITWDITKDGYMIPVVNIIPVKLGGVIISNITAYNGKYIVENKIGKDSVIKITRSGDVIPKIISIIKSSEQPLLPNTTFKWSKSGVDIINTDNKLKKRQLVKLLSYFSNILEIKNVDEATYNKLVENNLINKLIDIFYLKKADIIKLDGFQEKKTNIIIKEITDKINKMTLIDLMTASNLFGRNIGKKKIKKIIEIYPDIIFNINNTKKLIKNIDDIEGFDKITATQFVNGIKDFNVFLNNIPNDIKNKMILETIKIPKKNNKSGLLSNKKILMTGFRDKNLKEIIESHGGEVVDNISKTVDILITNDINSTSNKIETAKKYNIEIILKEEFIKKYL